MTQAQLERAVCRATGESREVIHRLGFQLVPPPKLILPRRRHRHKHRPKRSLAAAR